MWGAEVHSGFWWENLRGKSHLERPRHGWEGRIRIDFKALEWDGVDWINPAVDRNNWRAVVNATRNVRVLCLCRTGAMLTETSREVQTSLLSCP